jgi:hypothetical protein
MNAASRVLFLYYHNSLKPAEDAVTNGLLRDFCMARQQLMLWKMFVPCVTKIRKSLGLSAGLVFVSLSLCPGLECLLFYKGQAEMKWSLPSQACWSFNEDTIDLFFISYVSWVVAGVRTESASSCLQKCDRNSGCRFLHYGRLLGQLLYMLVYPSPARADDVSG